MLGGGRVVRKAFKTNNKSLWAVCYVGYIFPPLQVVISTPTCMYTLHFNKLGRNPTWSLIREQIPGLEEKVLREVRKIRRNT